ncbi:MAG: hypothetical protein ACK5OA_10005, partial [Acidovorax sp.]
MPRATAGLGDPGLLPQASAPPAKPRAAPKAAKTFEFQFGGFRGEAVPMGPPSKSGQTLYEVSWHVNGRVVSVQTKLTGQIGPNQFKPGSPLKGQLEQALRANQARETSPGSTAGLGYPGLLPQASPPPAKPRAAPKAAKTFEFQFGGFRGEAVPMGPPSKSGQTLYEVSWHVNGRVVSVQT